MKALSDRSMLARLRKAEASGDLMGILATASERPGLDALVARGLVAKRPRRLIGERTYRYVLTSKGRGEQRRTK